MDNRKTRLKLLASFLSAAILTAITYLAIFAFGSYGLALFVLVPFLVGFLPICINQK
mgnify:CR=1 FL=1